MYFKLAINNIRKSYKDYLVYFLTISFGICLFYLFNSLESQKSIMILDPAKAQAFLMLDKVLSYFSIFMSIVLAFLMVYANQFLIKRRKKEIGIYMTLGMERYKISFILVLETLVIGIVSLIAGLVLGVLGSHFLSILTAKMFSVDMKAFQFIFSKVAFLKSIMIFSIIYLVVMLLNVFNISKVKLIDLIYAGSKSQSMKVKSILVSIGLFLLSINSLLFAYYCINKNGMKSFDGYFNCAIIFGLIGTFLFYMSLSGILLQVVKSNKKFYYKRLNMFSVRQISSKVNTTYLMISILCILLLIAIGTFSTGMGIASVVNDTQHKSLPFDMTISQWIHDDNSLDTIMESDESLKSGSKIRFYQSDFLISQLTDITDFSGPMGNEFWANYKVEFITLTDYNNYLEMFDEEPVDLENEYIMTSNMEDILKLLRHNLKSIEMMNVTLTPKLIEDRSLRNEFISSSASVVVLPDNLIESLTPIQDVVNYLMDDLDPIVMAELLEPLWQEQFFLIFIKEQMIAESMGIKTIVAYVSLYVGLVFIMSTVACLALQQLSEASDNIERYDLLIKLGVEKKLISQSLLVQIAVYFFMPLGLAIVHSIVGISVASRFVQMFGKLDILKNMIITSVFVLLIYGSYFVVTYTAASAMAIKFNPVRKE